MQKGFHGLHPQAELFFITQSFDASAHIEDLGHSSFSLLLIGSCFCHVLCKDAVPHMSKPSFYFGSFHFNQVQTQKAFERDLWGRIVTSFFQIYDRKC